MTRGVVDDCELDIVWRSIARWLDWLSLSTGNWVELHWAGQISCTVEPFKVLDDKRTSTACLGRGRSDEGEKRKE